MIKNYFKTAWRNLIRNKFFSALNILGLALGLACSLLILLWVQSELNIDSFHKNGRRLFSVYERQYFDNKVRGQYSTPGILADEIKKVLPEVEYSANAIFRSHDIFRVGNKIIKMQGGAAGADFFKMFSYPILQGTAQTALNTPVSIAISRTMAENFYGSPQSALGKTITFNNKKDFKITAVFENIGSNSSQKFDYLLNWPAFQEENPFLKIWDSNWPDTFVMLRADADPVLFGKKITHFLDNYVKDQKKGIFTFELGIQAFADRYLHGNFEADGKPGGGLIEYVQLFSIVAVFILLIACINFMNLTTARSVKRAREIGVRKVVGAERRGLIMQFIGESLFITVIAAAISILLLGLLLPFFNDATQKQISLPFNQESFWLKVIGVAFVTGLISGSYPALFLSSFNPVKVLKGTFKMDSGTTIFRKGLVTFQFVLSVIMITGTIIITRQMSFIQSRNLGYDRENLIYVPVEGDLSSKYEVLKTEALAMPGIQSVSFTNSPPTYIDNGTEAVSWTGKDPNSNMRFVQTGVGYDFVNTLKLKLLAGRDFSKDFPSDSAGYIINEAALKRIGYNNPIGQPFALWGLKGKIIGLVKDFHINSLHEQIIPLIIWLDQKKQYGNLLIRTQPGKTKEALAGLASLCKQINPAVPFSYSFADEEYQKLYQNEQIISKLSKSFAFLAIFISCLGLLGLAMFTAEQRIKEISIRKVLGASVGSLFALLSGEFIKLVFIALLIASPVAWYVMNKWLQNYAYHTPLQWWMFVLSGAIVILITLLTVSFQSAKAALMNPVKSLRSE